MYGIPFKMPSKDKSSGVVREAAEECFYEVVMARILDWWAGEAAKTDLAVNREKSLKILKTFNVIKSVLW